MVSVSVRRFLANVKVIEFARLFPFAKEPQHFAGQTVAKPELALHFGIGGENLLVEPNQTGAQPTVVRPRLIIGRAWRKMSGRLFSVVVQGQTLARDSLRRTNRLGIAVI